MCKTGNYPITYKMLIFVIIWAAITSTVLLLSNLFHPTSIPAALFIKYSVTNRTFGIVGNEFMLDGQPLHIISGSLHYFRVPAAYWRDRLHKLKAAGLNSVSTYIEWSFHEPEYREYDFEGDRDIGKFIQTAGEEGLHVLLRPGPYICAERDLGGLPYWLLGKYPNITLRTRNQHFLNESKRWMKKLFHEIKQYLFGKDGPIIMIQIENEYGSYYKDEGYMKALRLIIEEEVKDDALLYTSDGFPDKGSVFGALPTINFGPRNDMKSTINDLRRHMPSGPIMNSEFYTGWISRWGEPFATKSKKDIVHSLVQMLESHISVNFYMFFGGTNFEFTSGASVGNDENSYAPVITSYDYDAPLSEAGDPTAKYYEIRDAILKFRNINAESYIKAPQPSPKGRYGTVVMKHRLNLLSIKGREVFGKRYTDVNGSELPTFESLGQRAGLVLYETTLDNMNGILEIKKPRDLVYVFIDAILCGNISRARKYTLPIKAGQLSLLSLLVENQGRVNFGPRIHDFKGIRSPVKFNNKVLDGEWKVTGFPLDEIKLTGINEDSNQTSKLKTQTSGPKLFQANFALGKDKPLLDSFLDTTGWGKGYIWINGYNLGRYWPSLGPQVTLYVPGAWLKPFPDYNNVIMLELEAPSRSLKVTFRDHPILNRTGDHYKYNVIL